MNDAPALKTADIGIAMGIAGTDVAKEAADLILLDDNFASIVAAIEEGRAVFENIRKFLTYILSSNIPELVPYLAFVLFRIPLPLTIIQILAVDLGTDMLPALALGAEKPDPGVMQRPPRARNERLLSWGLLARAYLFLGVLEAAAAMAVFFFVLDAAGWHYGVSLDRADPLYLQATTACLATIVVMQMMNVFLCRHPSKSSLSFGLFDNRYILLGLAAELGDDPVHHLYAGRQLAVRHGAHRRRDLAAGARRRRADVGAGGSAQGVAAAEAGGAPRGRIRPEMRRFREIWPVAHLASARDLRWRHARLSRKGGLRFLALH